MSEQIDQNNAHRPARIAQGIALMLDIQAALDKGDTDFLATAAAGCITVATLLLSLGGDPRGAAIGMIDAALKDQARAMAARAAEGSG